MDNVKMKEREEKSERKMAFYNSSSYGINSGRKYVKPGICGADGLYGVC